MRLGAIYLAGAAVLAAMAVSPASAVRTNVTHGGGGCDPLSVPTAVHELGTSPGFVSFPTEQISASATSAAACSFFDDPGTLNALVSITNLTGIAWAELWYVAHTAGLGVGTILSNQDGFVDDISQGLGGGQAFHIDATGANAPLVSESLAADGIFAPGETWDFIIDDYLNFGGLAADLLGSVGVGTLSQAGTTSSGSIIAVAVPEPGTFALVGVGLACIGARVRRGRPWMRMKRGLRALVHRDDAGAAEAKVVL